MYMGLLILHIFDIYNHSVSGSQRASLFQFYRCENRSWLHKSVVELSGAWTCRAPSKSMWSWGSDILDNLTFNILTGNNRKRNNNLISSI